MKKNQKGEDKTPKTKNNTVIKIYRSISKSIQIIMIQLDNK